MEKIHRDRLAEAVRLAEQNVAEGNGGPFGCVIYKNGELLAASGNSVTSTFDPTAHAEVNAIRVACARLGSWQLDGCEIYASSEPCPMCLAAIYWARPRAVYFANPKETAARFGFDDAFIYRQIPLAPAERSIRFESFLPEAAEAPFQAWQQKTDKTAY